MKIGFLTAGFLFLANPNLGIVDFLPDAVGYLLIIHALGVTPVIVPYFRDAARTSVALFAIEVIKLLCLPLLLKNITSLPLVLSFSFAIIELIFLIPLVGKLFNGLSYVGMRYDVPAILDYKEKEKINRDPSSGEKTFSKVRIENAPKIKRAAVVFFIFRALISLIPNLSDLQLTESDSKSTDVSFFKLSDFGNLFTAAALFFGLIAMIVILIRVVPFFFRISKDSAFKASFLSVCEKTKNDPVISRNFRMNRVTVLLGIAVVSSVFLIPDGVNYVVGAIPATLIALTALLLLKRCGKFVVISIIPAIGCAVFSILEFLARQKYFVELKNKPEAALWSKIAAAHYAKVEYYTLAERLLLLSSLIFILVVLFRVWTKDYRESADDGDEDMYSGEYHKRVSLRFKIAAVITIPIFVMSAIEPWLSVNIEIISTIITVVSFVWAVFTVFVLTDITKERYSLDPEQDDSQIEKYPAEPGIFQSISTVIFRSEDLAAALITVRMDRAILPCLPMTIPTSPSATFKERTVVSPSILSVTLTSSGFSTIAFTISQSRVLTSIIMRFPVICSRCRSL